MASMGKSGGQRTNLSSASGRKQRSPTSTAHKGSRVDPSHIVEHDREVRAKKVARKVTKKAAKAPTKKKS